MAGFRYMPLMISRLMLSLRKAADPALAIWTSAGQTMDDAVFLDALKFASPKGLKEEDTVSFDSFYEA